jgi:hypothetical protein
MKLSRGMAVVLRKKEQDARRAVIKFTSHKGQVLELQCDDGGSLVLFRDERRKWQDPTGAHWELQIAPPNDASEITRHFRITRAGRNRSSLGDSWRNAGRLGVQGLRKLCKRRGGGTPGETSKILPTLQRLG